MRDPSSVEFIRGNKTAPIPPTSNLADVFAVVVPINTWPVDAICMRSRAFVKNVMFPFFMFCRLKSPTAAPATFWI